MRDILNLFCFISSLAVSGQALRDINYNYLYNPGEAFSFDMKLVRQPDDFIVFYKLHVRDTSLRADDFSVQWESRETLGDKENTPLASGFQVRENTRDRNGFSGSVTLLKSSAPKVFVAKIIHTTLKRAWIFYEILEPNYPVQNYITINNGVLLKPFVNLTSRIVIQGSSQNVISFYDDDFPAALPPFAEAQGRVSKGMETDSTFQQDSNEEIIFSKPGLYLIQKDTNSAEGISLRVEDDYPRLAKIQSLAGPLMYICTKQEYDRLALAKNDKKTFDRIILSITNDTDRARKLIRNYFRRVELANQYFTSYKEGWKTDRGMIFIVFGLPDEVFKFSDREVWTYKNDLYRATLNFSKSSSVFDPENYVLIREKKFQETWYEVIDLWRNARF